MNNISYISGDTGEAAKEMLRLFGLNERSAGDNDPFVLEADQGRWQIRSLKDKNFGTVHV